MSDIVPYKIKAEIFFFKDKQETLYVCDPTSNNKCNGRKTGCHHCQHTTNKRFAKRFNIGE